MRILISISCIVWLFFCMTDLSGARQISQAESSPNIILIMADDLGYTELGSYGQNIIRTPNLDRMAEEGIQFTDFYAGSTVCAPSRDALMTGRHTGHSFVRGNFNPEKNFDLPLPDETYTIANYLKTAGYRTAMIGKWGLGRKPNTAHGFDYSFGYLSQLAAHDYYPPYVYENEEIYELSDNEGGEEQTYIQQVFAEKTLEYIETQQEQPFFLYLPYTIPHGPFNPPDDAPYNEEDWPQQKKNIAAMISMLDRDVGRILELLREKGIAETTVVFFTSDNGPTGSADRYFNSSGPFRGIKRDLYEGGIRVPMIAWGPGILRQGVTSGHISAAWDVLPTILELAGMEPPGTTDGISFLPELVGDSQPKHDFLYWEFYDYNWNWANEENTRPRNWLESQAVRYGKWKAVKNNIYENGEEALFELYELERDPAEQHDIAADHPDILQKIEAYVSGCCTSSLYFPYKE